MECIHSALQSRYTHNQQQITLLLCSAEANDKLSLSMCVCVYCCYRGSKHSVHLEGNTVKSICLGCMTIYHMSNYRTTHTHGRWDAFYCHQRRHCSFISRGRRLHEKKTEAIRRLRDWHRERNMLACMEASFSKWVSDWVHFKELSWLKYLENVTFFFCLLNTP